MGSDGKESKTTEETENLWDKILKEASRSVADRLESKHILLIGDRNAGKSTLLGRLQNIDIGELQRGFALDYSFIDIHSSPEADDDPVSRINVWQLEGEPEHKDLLRFAINETTITNCLVVIAVDFSQPWILVESLNKWLELVKKHIAALQEKLPLDEVEETKRYLIYDFQQYAEPTGQAHPSVPMKQLKKRKPVEEQALLPLGDGVLTNNLGVPIVVVCCKSDMTETLEKEYGYKEAHFDFIQQYLRRICLSYGAALIYTSAKKEKNCDVLLQYLRHKLYGFDFVHKLQLVEKDTILMPAGADSMTKINVDFGSQNLTKDAEEPYEEVIKIPKRLQVLNSSKGVGATLTVADDDQEFLSKHKEIIEKEAVEGSKEPKATTKGPMEIPVATAKQQQTTLEIKEPVSSPIKPTPPPIVEIKPPPTTAASLTAPGGVNPDREHQVLAEFFNSLIHKDNRAGPAAPGTRAKPDLKEIKDFKIPARGSGGTSPSFNNREDVAKQLDRIRNKYQSN